jgi:hypothetical protein
VKVDNAEFSWDQSARKWLLRIKIGEEVIRRQCPAPKDADDAQLRSLAEKSIRDDGYEADSTPITILR